MDVKTSDCRPRWHPVYPPLFGLDAGFLQLSRAAIYCRLGTADNLSALFCSVGTLNLRGSPKGVAAIATRYHHHSYTVSFFFMCFSVTQPAEVIMNIAAVK